MGRLTRKLASLPLIKVFCSRIWRIGFASTGVANPPNIKVLDWSVAAKRLNMYSKRSAVKCFQASSKESFFHVAQKSCRILGSSISAACTSQG